MVLLASDLEELLRTFEWQKESPVAEDLEGQQWKASDPMSKKASVYLPDHSRTGSWEEVEQHRPCVSYPAPKKLLKPDPFPETHCPHQRDPASAA
jgi:hypothetical protein